MTMQNRYTGSDEIEGAPTGRLLCFTDPAVLSDGPRARVPHSDTLQLTTESSRLPRPGVGSPDHLCRLEQHSQEPHLLIEQHAQYLLRELKRGFELLCKGANCRCEAVVESLNLQDDDDDAVPNDVESAASGAVCNSPAIPKSSSERGGTTSMDSPSVKPVVFAPKGAYLEAWEGVQQQYSGLLNGLWWLVAGLALLRQDDLARPYVGQIIQLLTACRREPASPAHRAVEKVCLFERSNDGGVTDSPAPTESRASLPLGFSANPDDPIPELLASLSAVEVILWLKLVALRSTDQSAAYASAATHICDLKGSTNVMKASVSLDNDSEGCDHTTGESSFISPSRHALDKLIIEASAAVPQFVLNQQDGRTGLFEPSASQWISEGDLRFTLCALGLLRCTRPELLTCRPSRMDHDCAGVDRSKLLGTILASQSYDGGFGSGPGSEAHAGYTFCAVAALGLLEELDLLKRGNRLQRLANFLEFRRVGRWKVLTGLLQRSRVSRGEPKAGLADVVPGYTLRRGSGVSVAGLNGRPGKAADVCYGWWVIATEVLLQRQFGRTWKEPLPGVAPPGSLDSRIGPGRRCQENPDGEQQGAGDQKSRAPPVSTTQDFDEHFPGHVLALSCRFEDEVEHVARWILRCQHATGGFSRAPAPRRANTSATISSFVYDRREQDVHSPDAFHTFFALATLSLLAHEAVALAETSSPPTASPVVAPHSKPPPPLLIELARLLRPVDPSTAVPIDWLPPASGTTAQQV